MKNILMALFVSMITLISHAADTVSTQVVDILVTEKGFEPNKININPEKSVTLSLIRKTDSTCATQIQIPSLKIKKDLPLNQIVKIDLGKLQKGEIRFGCGMNMMEGGKIYIK